MNDCLFCKIIKREVPAKIVHEDDLTLAFLDIRPVNPGHTLVVPKEHGETILDVSEESACAVMKTVKKITPAILASVGSTNFNLGVNAGKGAGQVIPHYHLHIMPRLENDGYDLWHGSEMGAEEIEAIAESIRERLNPV